MAVITKYVVERNGVEKMTFTSKAEADAYDKMLDMADALQLILQESTLVDSEQQAESLALYLAQQKEALLVALGVKKAPAKAMVQAEPTEQVELTAVKKSTKAEQAA
ncbi:YebG family protein [Alishewanella sp. d11]|uniref:YebG family protein n=1 Tax=Alishewanella sp. d11 TaxID=3414030 RepID=UPI003BF8E3CA